MTLAEYQTLTGVTVSTEDATRVTAVLKRSQAKLEGLLGYSLSKQKTWTELGKVQYSGLTPFPSLPVSDEVLDNLQPADTTTGDIQLFNFDELDTHIRINPATEIYKAKIVLPVSADEFITIYDLENVTPYLNEASLVVAVTRYYNWFTWANWNSLLVNHGKNMMIAVEAEYVDACDVNKYPDLAYLLADMVTYYTDPGYSLLGNIQNESIDSHSYSRANTGSNPGDSGPESQMIAKQTIEKYAGPAKFRKLVR